MLAIIWQLIVLFTFLLVFLLLTTLSSLPRDCTLKVTKCSASTGLQVNREQWSAEQTDEEADSWRDVMLEEAEVGDEEPVWKLLQF